MIALVSLLRVGFFLFSFFLSFSPLSSWLLFLRLDWRGTGGVYTAGRKMKGRGVERGWERWDREIDSGPLHRRRGSLYCRGVVMVWRGGVWCVVCGV